MKNTTRFFTAGRIIYGIPWLIVAIQHFIYADFVSTIVPAYMPFRLFWVYLTAAAMIAAGTSFITGIRYRLAGLWLGIMMIVFILLIHLPRLSADPSRAMTWTRAMQDLSITGIACMIAGMPVIAPAPPGKLGMAGRWMFALPLLFLGAQHFAGAEYVTGQIPDWLPPRIVWNWLTGLVIVLGAGCILLQKRERDAATVLAYTLLGLAVVYHLPLLIADPHNGGLWTGSMLDLMIGAGPLILTGLLQEDQAAIPQM